MNPLLNEVQATIEPFLEGYLPQPDHHPDTEVVIKVSRAQIDKLAALSAAMKGAKLAVDDHTTEL